jgi:hypothetical protein
MASGEGRCFFDFLLERDYTRMIWKEYRRF